MACSPASSTKVSLSSTSSNNSSSGGGGGSGSNISNGLSGLYGEWLPGTSGCAELFTTLMSDGNTYFSSKMGRTISEAGVRSGQRFYENMDCTGRTVKALGTTVVSEWPVDSVFPITNNVTGGPSYLIAS